MRQFTYITMVAAAGAVMLAGCAGQAASAAGSTAPSLLAAAAPVGNPGAVAPVADAGQIAAAITAVQPASGDLATITTVGTGKVKGTPDVMTITLGVETRSASAQEALAQNNVLAADVIAVLKASGVADADLQTSQFYVNPTYGEKNEITGYSVTNTVTATLRDITAAGSVIDAVAQKAGDAVRVQQIGFSIDDDSELRAAARADAVKQAQAQAGQLAAAAGVPLGALRSITEVSAASPMPFYAASDMAGGRESVPLEVGSQQLTVTVQVVYDLG